MSELSTHFRTAFRQHPAGVALVTAMVEGKPYGLTISSLASLSIDPVAVSFSLAKESGAAGAVLSASSFVIHMLGEEQQELAESFANPRAPRFTDDQDFRILPTGEPHFIESPVAFRASIHSSVSVGGSRLIAAEIHEVLHGTANQQHLLYQDREYIKLSNMQTLASTI